MRKFLIIALLISSFGKMNAQGSLINYVESNFPMFQFRMGIGPLYAIFGNNNTITSSAQTLMGGSAYLMPEFHVGNRVSILFGAMYSTHGESFNSYHFDGSGQNFYNQKYNYQYKYRNHEAWFPLYYKFSKQKEYKADVSQYIKLGFVFRYAFGGKLEVKELKGGKVVENISGPIPFQNSMFGKNTNALGHLGIGIQRNYDSFGAVFAELNFYLNYQRYLISNAFAPANLYLNPQFLSLNIGVKL